MNVISIDPGLASFGAVTFMVDPTDRTTLGTRCLDVSFFSTESRAEQWSWNMVDDITRRGRELARWLERYVVTWGPKAVFAERMGVFNAKRGLYTQILNSVAWGVVVAEMQRRLLPLTIVAPTTWRLSLAGSKNEKAAQAYAMNRHPSYSDNHIDGDNRVHCRDALGVFAWAHKSGLMLEGRR